MSRFVNRDQSFLNGQPVFVADVADTRSPYHQFLANKGAIIQAQPNRDTRFVITQRTVEELPEHIRESVANALANSEARYYYASQVRTLLDAGDLRCRRTAVLTAHLAGDMPSFIGV